MPENEGAQNEAGTGAPAGGSPEGGSENEDLGEKFEKRIKSALASQRAHYESQLGNVRSEFEAFKAGAGSTAKPADQPQRYTRAQMKAAVDAGQISQEQADEAWAKQIEQTAIESATAAVTGNLAEQKTKERIDSDLKSYKRLKPDILDKSSETFQAIKAAFDDLRETGMPNDLRTELAAIKSVLGPVEKLEKASKASRSQEHEEQGGGEGGAPKQKAGSGKKLHQYLSGDAKAYYEDGIKKGRYKDWDAVDAELKYARGSTRQRLGLPQA
jgi:hypothetical protein